MEKEKKRVLWLDDSRNPKYFNGGYLYDNYYEVVWVKNYDEFVDSVKTKDFDKVFFDHDLGMGKNGYDCAKFLVDYCLGNKKPIPDCWSQSSNPAGRESIMKYIEDAKKKLS